MRRKNSYRMAEYDYKDVGYYFVTTNIKNPELRLGEVNNGEMILNDLGQIVKNVWLDLPKHYSFCQVDYFIVMPDHFHEVLILEDQYVQKIKEKDVITLDCEVNVRAGFNDVRAGLNDVDVGAGFKPAPTENKKRHSLSEIMRGFKTFSSRKINDLYPHLGFQWQRSFYDRIIRDEAEYLNICEYIENNSLRWHLKYNLHESDV